MAPGKGPGFPTAQKDWIEKHIPEYLKKTKFGKIPVLGQPLPTDDKDKYKWVEALRDEFEKVFTNELTSELDKLDSDGKLSEESTAKAWSDMRNRFDAKFRNAKSRAGPKWEETYRDVLAQITPSSNVNPSTSTSTTRSISASLSTPAVGTVNSAPFFLLKETQVTGRMLFQQDVSDVINVDVKNQREANKIDHTQHPKMYQEELKRRWDNVSEADKAKWDAQAAAANASTNQSEKIYQNQALFPYELRDLLCNLNRCASNQIGNASFHLLYGFRDKNETLKTGAISVQVDNVDFETSVTNYRKQIMLPWSKYCQSHIKNNASPTKLQELVFDVDNMGRPLLPEFSEETMTLSCYRRLLHDFLAAQWRHCRSLPSDASISWDSMPDGVLPYISHDLSQSLPGLANPCVMPFQDIVHIVTTLRDHQQRNGALDLFHSQPISHAHTATPPFAVFDAQVTTADVTRPSFLESVVTNATESATHDVMPPLMAESTLNGYSSDPPFIAPAIAAPLVASIMESATSLATNPASLLTTIPTTLTDDPSATNKAQQPPSDAVDDLDTSPSTSGKRLKGKRSRGKAAANNDHPPKRCKTMASVTSGESQAGRQSTRLKSKKDNVEAVTKSPEPGMSSLSRNGKPRKPNKYWSYELVTP